MAYIEEKEPEFDIFKNVLGGVNRHIRKDSEPDIDNGDGEAIDIGVEAKTTRKKKKSKQKNPFLEYGTAIENFFNLECALIGMFFVLTLLAIPQMIIFASYNSMKDFETAGFTD